MSRASPLDSQQTRRPGIGQRSHTMPRPAIAPLKIPAENTRRSTNRWSEIVPPHTALTFFAVYDPSEGLVGFSGSSLLPVDSSHGQLRTPGIPHDGQSEVFAIDRLGPGTSALSTAAMTSNTAMSDMQAMMDAYFRGDRWQVDREALLATDATPRVSSTLEGLHGMHVEPSSSDTLLGSMEKTLSGDLDGRSTCSDDFIPCHSRSNTLDSPCDLDSGYGSAGEDTIHARAPYTREINDSFYVYDDYSCDRLNEHSAFSVTTTSTSSYIDVNTPSTAAFYHPITPTPPNKKYASLAEEVESLNILAYIQARPKTPVSRPRQSPSTPCSSSPSSPSSQFSRKLRKLKSTAALPTPPADVLSRETYNHHWDDGEAKPTSPSKPRLHNSLSKRFLRIKRGVDDNRWVLVDIEHKITLRDLQNVDL